MPRFITHRADECAQFFSDYIVPDRRIIFVGTLGFSDTCLHFPQLLSKYKNVSFLFLIEDRVEVADILVQMANRNREVLLEWLGEDRVSFEHVRVIADDTANVAGRNATRVCHSRMSDGFTDIFVDASSMSRGVCFPIVKQSLQICSRTSGLRSHVVVAGQAKSTAKARSMSSDAPQYMHGFQSNMDVEESHDSIRLWIPQLAEGAAASLSRIHRRLNPSESCPILPFPAADPLRGDKLLREFQVPILSEWDVNLLDVIYADESDPNDVCETIMRIHGSRHEALSRATGRENPDRTVLSPAGNRIGSIGMLLASLTLDLPIMYEESIGYTSLLKELPPLAGVSPEYRWHVWLKP